MGIVFVFLASLSVAFGTYAISSALVSDPQILKQFAWLHSRYALVVGGLILNLFGSCFWIFGRKMLSSYTFAWSLYIGLLIVFGTLIASFIEAEKMQSTQIAGLLLLIISLSLLKK